MRVVKALPDRFSGIDPLGLYVACRGRRERFMVPSPLAPAATGNRLSPSTVSREISHFLRLKRRNWVGTRISVGRVIRYDGRQRGPCSRVTFQPACPLPLRNRDCQSVATAWRSAGFGTSAPDGGGTTWMELPRSQRPSSEPRKGGGPGDMTRPLRMRRFSVCDASAPSCERRGFLERVATAVVDSAFNFRFFPTAATLIRS